MRIVVDRDRCAGMGACQAVAPRFFELRDDGELWIVDERPDAAHRGVIETVVASCPTEALTLVFGPDTADEAEER